MVWFLTVGQKFPLGSLLSTNPARWRARDAAAFPACLWTLRGRGCTAGRLSWTVLLYALACLSQKNYFASPLPIKIRRAHQTDMPGLLQLQLISLG